MYFNLNKLKFYFFILQMKAGNNFAKREIGHPAALGLPGTFQLSNDFIKIGEEGGGGGGGGSAYIVI